MNLKSSVKVDVGGSVNGAADAAAKAKADVSGGLKGAAGAAAGVKADVSGKVSGAVSGAKDAVGAVKDKVTGVVESAKDAAAGAVSAAKEKAGAAMDAAKEKAAEMKAQCSAAVDKFKGSVVAPANGWKAGFAAAGSITIGKSFSTAAGITLNNDKYKLTDELTVIFNIDPDDVESGDDRFVLFSTDEAKTYCQEKTAKDDIKKGDNSITLKFDGLDDELNYSLEVNPGDGNAYLVFEDRPYGDW